MARKVTVDCSIAVSLLRELPVGLLEKLTGRFVIGGWSCVCQPYTESATTLSEE